MKIKDKWALQKALEAGEISHEDAEKNYSGWYDSLKGDYMNEQLDVD